MVALLALVLGGVGGWLLTRSDDDGSASGDGSSFDVVLRDVETREDLRYRFPAWWGDGQASLTLTPTRSGMLLRDPLAERRTDPEPTAFARIEDASVEPAAVAALPGGGGIPWLAVGFPDDLPSAERADSAPVVRATTWTGAEEAERGDEPRDPGAGTTLPLRTTAYQYGGGGPQFGAALARIDGRVRAYVTADQRTRTYRSGRRERRQLFAGDATCPDVRRCRWRVVPRPDGQPSYGLGSTGSGFVLVTRGSDDRLVVRYADDAALTWREVGRLPAGSTLQTTQSGDGRVLLVTLSRAGGARSVAVTAVDAGGRMSEAVTPAEVPDDLRRVGPVLRVGDDWLLGGAARAQKVDLRYDSDAAVLLRRDGDRWASVGGAELAAQPDQVVTALQLGPPERQGDERPIEMATSSAVLRINEIWQVRREGD